MSTPAYVTPQIIEWARLRAGITIDELAIALKTSAVSVKAWELGSQRPTFSKAEALAKRLRIPFGYLFLSEAPASDIPIPDLRTESGQMVTNPSLNFGELIHNTLLKQQWFSDYLQEINHGKLPFVGM